MGFRHFDNLRTALRVAEHSSLAEAATVLNMTKGALSQQIKKLENDLGFTLFERHARGIRITPRGDVLLKNANASFTTIEQLIQTLRTETERTLVIGTTTYFASRWLSKRLMSFMQAHPEIPLRIQPMTEPYVMQGSNIDIAIRWGRGDWLDCELDCLFLCPAWPTGNRAHKLAVETEGFAAALAQSTLLRDKADSTAWQDWCELAGLELSYRKEALIIPDPNVRVQAVIDGQGIGINDALVQAELDSGTLYQLNTLALNKYGYFLAYTPNAIHNADVCAFISWIKSVV